MEIMTQFELKELIKVYARMIANQFGEDNHVTFAMQDYIVRMQELSKCLTTGTPQPEYSYEPETENNSQSIEESVNQVVDRWMEDCRPQVYDMEIKSLKYRIKKMFSGQ